MDSQFWDERYRRQGYAYGNEPNDFLREQRFTAGERVLCLAEGEGRNAVWLARQGCRVTAVDFSEEGIRKMKQLAGENGVEVNAVCADLSEYAFQPKAWDAIVMIFGHFPPDLRSRVLSQLHGSLREGGRLIMEVYHTEQLKQGTGGPQDPEMLYSEEILKEALHDFPSLHIEKMSRSISEGNYHQGTSVVLRVTATA